MKVLNPGVQAEMRRLTMNSQSTTQALQLRRNLTPNSLQPIYLNRYDL